MQCFSTLITTQSNTSALSNSAKIFKKRHGISPEMLEKSQQVSATNWHIKSYRPRIRFYHSEILTEEKKELFDDT